MICSSSSEDEEEDDIDAYANNNTGNKLPVPNGNVQRLVLMIWQNFYFNLSISNFIWNEYMKLYRPYIVITNHCHISKAINTFYHCVWSFL